MSLCIRSWPPLSWGLEGLERAISIPRLIHQAVNFEIPPLEREAIKGVPLSHWMVFGIPYLRNNFSNSALTATVVPDGSDFMHRTNRLKASRTVSGLQRSESRVC